MEKARILLTALLAVCIVLFALVVWRGSQESQWASLMKNAQSEFARENYDAAADQYKQAAKVAKASFGENDPRYMETLKRLAWVLNAAGDYSGGRTLFKKVFSLTEEEVAKIRFAQMPIASLDSYSIDPRSGGEASETGLRMASQTIEKYLGDNDPELVPLLDKLADVCAAKDPPDYADAERQRLRILDIMKAAEGADSVGVANAHMRLGDLYWRWTDKPEHKNAAGAQYSEAAKLYSALLGPQSPMTQAAQQRQASGPPALPPRQTDLPAGDMPKL